MFRQTQQSLSLGQDGRCSVFRSVSALPIPESLRIRRMYLHELTRLESVLMGTTFSDVSLNYVIIVLLI